MDKASTVTSAGIFSTLSPTGDQTYMHPAGAASLEQAQNHPGVHQSSVMLIQLQIAVVQGSITSVKTRGK